MPKFLVPTPEVGVPIPNEPQASPGQFSQSAEALAQGAHRVEAYGLETVRHVNAMMAQQEKDRQISAALDSVYTAKRELTRQDQNLRQGTFDEQGVQIEPPAESKDYWTKSDAAARQIGVDTAATIKDPMVRDVFTRQWKHELITHTIDAGHYQQHLFVTEQAAEVQQRYHDALRIGAGAQDPVDGQRYTDLFRVYLASKERALGAKEVQRIRESFDKDWNTHLARQAIRNNTFVRSDWEGKLDPGVLDNLEVRNDANVAHAQIAYNNSIKNWSESVEREAVRMLARGEMSQEFLDDYKNAFTSEKLDAYNKAYREQQLGTSVFSGDPSVMARMEALIGNRSSLFLNPEQTLADLTRAYAQPRPTVSTKMFVAGSSLLNTEIEKRRNDAKVERTADETRIHQIQGNQYHSVMGYIDAHFRVTNRVENYDAVLTNAMVAMKEEIGRRGLFNGGTENEFDLYRELLPKYLSIPAQRANDAIKVLTEALGPYNTKEKIQANRRRLGDSEYYRLSNTLEMISALRTDQLAKQQAIEAAQRAKGVAAGEPK